jgi:hypothetical protein
VCQTPRSLGDVRQQWTEPLRGTMEPISLVTQQAPSDDRFFRPAWDFGSSSRQSWEGFPPLRASRERSPRRLLSY